MRLRALGCSLGLHAGGVAVAAGNPVFALLLLAGSLVFLKRGVVHIVIGPDWRFEGRRAAYALTTIFLLAVLWLVIQSRLNRFVAGGSGIPGKARMVRVIAADQSSGEKVKATIAFDETHPGVIVFSEKEKQAVVPPTPRTMHAGESRGRPSDPQSIPFTGAYWLYQSPRERPPSDSYIAWGRPSEMRFRTSDQTPLRMEARQNLGRLVDLACCSMIQLALFSADNYPGSVQVELILVNTALPGGPSQSLGVFPVTTFVGLGRWNESIARAETLSFRVPAQMSISTFDELRVVFHLDRIREDRSARIAIDRFVLVPRRL